MNQEPEPISQRKWIAALCGAFATGALVAGACVWMIIPPARMSGERTPEPSFSIGPSPAQYPAVTSDAPDEGDDWHRALLSSHEVGAEYSVQVSDAEYPPQFAEGIQVSVSTALSADGATPEGEIALDGENDGKKKRVTVTNGEGGVMHVNVYTGYKWDESSIVLTLTDGEMPSAGPRVSAAWRKWIDVGAQNDTRARAFGGRVTVNTANWRTTRPLILEWDIYGVFNGGGAWIRLHHDKVLIR